jgi:hypothetical protein
MKTGGGLNWPKMMDLLLVLFSFHILVPHCYLASQLIATTDLLQAAKGSILVSGI